MTQNGLALQLVKILSKPGLNLMTEEVCIAAVKQNGLALRYIRNQTLEICTLAVKQNSNAIKYAKIYVNIDSDDDNDNNNDYNNDD